jgi:CubicO group peptidase (beta-lactamase class C family)
MSRNLQLIACTALIVVAHVIGAPALLAAPSKRSIDKTVVRAMQEFQVPGIAVSVVYDGKLFYSAGHGVLESGAEDPVDDQTLFQIGSVSKAFTTAALALLADEGSITCPSFACTIPGSPVNSRFVTC